MIYYKLVNLNLESYNQNRIADDGYSIRYKIGEWVQPKIKGSKLFVFKDLHVAQSYLTVTHRLFSCEVKGVYRGKYKFFIHNYQKLAIEKFWSRYRNGKNISDIIDINTSLKAMIDNTVYVNEIKLIEEIR